MFLGMIVVCIMGNYLAGGTREVYTTAKQLGRMNFNKYAGFIFNKHVALPCTQLDLGVPSLVIVLMLNNMFA